jgi:hypothetical protein
VVAAAGHYPCNCQFMRLIVDVIPSSILHQPIGQSRQKAKRSLFNFAAELPEGNDPSPQSYQD